MQTEEQVQTKQAEQEVQHTIEHMLAEVKRQMKPKSKNELIRIIGALLLDNYSLKMTIESSKPQPTAEGSVETKND